MSKIIDSNYTGLFQEGNVQLICKMGKYTSPMSNKEVDICTNFIILEDGKKVYEVTGDNNWIAYNDNTFISMAKYAELVVFYWANETADAYWKKIFLDDFFLASTTIKLDIYYKNVSRRLKDEQRWEEQRQQDIKLNALKEEIATLKPCSYNYSKLVVWNDKSMLSFFPVKRNFKDTENYSDMDKLDSPQYGPLLSPYIEKYIVLSDYNSTAEKIEVLEKLVAVYTSI